MLKVLFLMLSSSVFLLASGGGHTEIAPDLTGTWVGIASLVIFVIGYYFVAAEEKYHIDKAKPDFEIYVNPSVLNLRSGMSTPVTFNICRKDGFKGAVDLSVKNAPKDVRLDGRSIQKGSSKARMTLFVPNSVQPQNYKIEAYKQQHDL